MENLSNVKQATITWAHDKHVHDEKELHIVNSSWIKYLIGPVRVFLIRILKMKFFCVKVDAGNYWGKKKRLGV